MDLQTLRSMFITLSGRYDLQSNTAMADFFINKGLRFLETTTNVYKNEGKHVVTVTAGSYYVDVPNLRTLHEVSIFKNDKLVPLTILSYDDFLDLGELPNRVSAATPKYCTIAPSRPVPLTLTPPTDGSAFDLATDDLTTRIVFTPKNDVDLSFTIIGLFYLDPLTNDTDTNWWTDTHEELVLYASLYVLESFYRNTEGMKDWLNAMQPLLTGLEKDIVDFESTGKTQMEG